VRTSLQLLSQPAYEPVSLAEARRWLRLPLAADDTDTANTPTLQLLIKAMREDAENLTFRAYIQRTHRLNLDCYPSDDQYGHKIELPFAPCASVESFKYYDTDGVLTTLATDQYVLHNEAEPAYIIPAYQCTWPTYRSLPNAIQISYTAGYAPGSPSDEASNQEVMPGQLRLWMQAKLATLYEQREQLITGTIVAKLPRDFTDGLLDSLIIGDRIF
jgi:uncharacterized phiE125 gp8 family phage protein